MFLFMTFIVSSCLPEITHRLRADLFVFNHPLNDILDEWSPKPEDHLNPTRVRIHEVHILRQHLPKALVPGKKDIYEWSITTASMWVSALCHLIKEAKRSADGCLDPSHKTKTINSDALRELILVLSSLHFLSSRVPIRQLFALPSILSKLEHEVVDNIDASIVNDDELISVLGTR